MPAPTPSPHLPAAQQAVPSAAAPTLTGLSPSSGPASGGTVVTLTGTGFTGATAVRFGGNAAGFTVVSSTRITATAPPGSGTVSVTVRTPAGTSNGLPYTYTAPPVVTSVDPSQGPTFGGNTVTITGTGLSGATGVLFGGVPALDFTVLSPTRVSAVVPPGPPGAVQVRVVTHGGTSAPGVFYFYVVAPFLTGLTPDLAPTTGGNTVTITGTGLALTSAVRFGTTPVAFTVLSDSQVSAVAPAGSGTVEVTLTTPGGISNSVYYAYLSAPAIEALAPAEGPEVGGNTVLITGSLLASTTDVFVGLAPAVFTALSDTQVVAVMPAGTGTAPVTVTTAGGTSNSLPYTYVPPPG